MSLPSIHGTSKAVSRSLRGRRWKEQRFSSSEDEASLPAGSEGSTNLDTRIKRLTAIHGDLPQFKDRRQSWARYFEEPGPAHSALDPTSPPTSGRPRPQAGAELVEADDAMEVDSITHYVQTTRNDRWSLHNDKELHSEFFPAFETVKEAHPEVDSPQTVTPHPARPPSSPVHPVVRSYFVADTNFLLSHLNIIDDLTQIGHRFEHQLVIPRVVLKELDGLKKSSHTGRGVDLSGGTVLDKSISYLARQANTWIYHAFAERRPGVVGQKIHEVVSRLNMDPDDAIHDCCLYYKQKSPLSAVVLLSNDKNLCNKVLIDGLLTVSFRPSMTAEKIASVAHAETRSVFEQSTRSVATTAPPRPSRQLKRAPIPARSVVPSGTPPASRLHLVTISSFGEAIEVCLREITLVLIQAVNHCIERAHGNVLRQPGYRPEHLTDTESCSRVMRSLWTTVFERYFAPSSMQNPNLRSDQGMFVTAIMSNRPANAGEFERYVTYWTALLQALYAQRDVEQRQSLEMLKDRWLFLSRNCSQA